MSKTPFPTPPQITLRKYFDIFEPIIIFEESLQKYKQYKSTFEHMMISSSGSNPKNMLDMLVKDVKAWLNRYNPGENLNIEVDKIMRENCKNFKTYLLSDNKYEDKDLCTKIYTMSLYNTDFLIFKTCFFERQELYGGFSCGDTQAFTKELKELSDSENILKAEVEKLIHHVNMNYNDYFNCSESVENIVGAMASLDTEDTTLIGSDASDNE